MPSSSEMIYVQAPAWSSINQAAQQPIISPAQIPDSQLGQVMHFWPRSVSYTMETKGISPVVQPDLSLGVQYSYQFTFELGAASANGKPAAIPDGWYQLQLAVIRKSNKDIVGFENENPWDRYITSTSTFLRVNNGSIRRSISMHFSDLRHTISKHHLYVELIPLKEQCSTQSEQGEVNTPCIRLDAKGRPDPLASVLDPRPDMKTYIFEMPFVPYMAIPGKSRDVQDLEDLDVPWNDSSLSLYVNRARAYKSRQLKRSMKILNSREHAANENLPLRTVDDAEFKSVRGSLERLLTAQAIGNLKPGQGFESLYSVLCEQLASMNHERREIRRLNRSLFSLMQKADQAQLSRCAAKPQDYLRITRITHLGKPILSEAKRVFQKPLIYTLMANYMSNRSASIDSISGVNISSKIPQLPVVSPILEKLGLGISAAHSVNYANTRSRAETGIASMSDSLDFNYHVMRIPVLGSQNCLEVRAVAGMRSTIFDNTKGASNGFYLCAPVNEQKFFVNEVYAHTYERCRETSSTDCDSLSQSINVFVRGDRQMSQFFYQARKGVIPDHKNMVTPFGDMDGANRYFAHTPLSGQMQIVNPVEFPHDPIPSYWERISGAYREEFKD